MFVIVQQFNVVFADYDEYQFTRFQNIAKCMDVQCQKFTG